MSQQPLITTVIPTYRRPKLLRRAIQSVLNQTYPHFQVCVYDNASGDETEAVVAEIMRRDFRVRYHRHEQNIGMMPNFAHGVAHVESEYFNVLSDDDVLLPRFFEAALTALKSYPEARFFVGLMLSVDKDGTVRDAPQRSWRAGFILPPELFPNIVDFSAHCTWTSMLFNTDLIASVGGIDPDIGAPSDLDFEARIAARWPGVVSHEPCAIFWAHPASFSAAHWATDFGAAHLTMRNRLAEAIDNASRAGVVKNRECLQEMLRRKFREWLRRGALSTARRGDREATNAITSVLEAEYGERYFGRAMRLVSARSALGATSRLTLAEVAMIRTSIRKATRPRIYDGLVSHVLSGLEDTPIAAPYENA